MKTLFAKQLPENSYEIGSLLEDKHKIAYRNWGNSHNVEASFNIGYNSKNIFLQFSVVEDYVRGLHTNLNDPVYEDSCVEFFLEIEKEGYYNFEVNCIGNVLAEYGKNRKNRQLIDEILLSKIITNPSLGKNKIDITDRRTMWSVDVIIPISVFIYSGITTFDSLKSRCNFYKCGDKLKHPHYLTWTPINSKTPDFHKPEFFGTMIFN